MDEITDLAGQLPRVLDQVRRAGLTGDSAETTALRVLLQFHHRQGPDWLRRTDDATRLAALTALALTRRRGPGPQPPRDPSAGPEHVIGLDHRTEGGRPAVEGL